MGVQVQPAKPKDQFNGLGALESDLIADDEQTVTAVVQYRVAKVVEDKKKDETYPVLYVVAIEPVRGDLESKVLAAREAAYKARTGEDQLDLDFSIEDAAEGE